MNRVYSKVWNRSLGVMVVASELARQRGGVVVRTARRSVAATAVLCAALPFANVQAADVCQQTGDGGVPVASGANAFACGNGARATAANATAVGAAQATAISATAVGGNARAQGANATAVGGNALASTASSTALGSNARASGLHASAVGYGAQALSAGSVAFGFNSIVLVQASNSVALGYGARALQADTFSVGSGGGAATVGPATRRIVNVTQGVDPTDAVNVAQLTTTVDGATRYFQATGLEDGSDDAEASGEDSVAAGARAVASDVGTTAVGAGAVSSSAYATAVGGEALATGNYATAVGYLSEASGDGSIAYGAGSYAADHGTSALGWNATADRAGSTAVGHGATASNYDSTAVGAGALATGTNSVAVGGAYMGVAPAEAEGDYSTAVGGGAWAAEFSSTALGNASQALGYNSVALGAESIADRDFTVSVGSAGNERQITNVAAGTAGTDAVNLDQLTEVSDGVGELAETAIRYDDADKDDVTLGGASGTRIGNLARGEVSTSSMDAINGGQLYDALDSTAQILGGGSSVTAFGTITAPSYTIQGGVYFSVGDALSALDVSIGGLDARLSLVEGTANRSASSSSPQTQAARRSTAASDNVQEGGVAAGAPEVAQAQRSATSANAIGEGAQVLSGNSVALGAGSVADRDNTVSVGAEGSERQVTNVAAGTAETDAVNVSQMRAEDTRTLSSAQSYTDAKFMALEDDFDAYRGVVDKRFHAQDRRISQIGALSSAMVQMTANAANGNSPRGRIAVGAGFMSGEQALSVGYGRRIGERASFTIGGAFSGSERTAGIGFGVDL